uniref:Regulator of G protein signaling 13 n=1 Tax=Strigops habroptila TaxID=2489341 RepID=A0A672UU26_STRHB
MSVWICLIMFMETRKNKFFCTLSLHSEMPLRLKRVLHMQENAMLKYGPMIYKTYLKTEHSDENIEFWLACEAYKKITSQRKRISMARKLFTTYIQPQAPNEVNIDSPARKAIIRNIQKPTQSCFDEAQRIIYMHMERDSYPRFLESKFYQNLKHSLQNNGSDSMVN